MLIVTKPKGRGLRALVIPVLVLLGLGGGVCAPLAAQEIGSDINEKEATAIRNFSFEAADDVDYDGKPDDWSRRVGDGFPAYVRSTIDRTTGRDGSQSLRFDLNGAAAAIYSPPVLIDQQYSLFVRGTIRTKGMSHSAALISVSLLDHRRRRLGRSVSKAVTGTHNEWVDVQIGPIHPDHPARFVVVGCHIVDAERSDITGSAWFDDIWIRRIPRMTLAFSPDRHVISAGQGLDIRTSILGLETNAAYDLALKVSDLDSREVLLQSKPLPPSPDRTGPVGHTWSIPPQSAGHYRVEVRLARGGRTVLSRDSAFAVVDDTERQERGEFGWSLPRGLEGMTPAAVAELARRAHLHHLKIPLWSAAELEIPGTPSQATQLLDLMEKNRIQTIGLLNDPPPSLRAKFVDRTPVVSKILAMPKAFWAPSLEPLIVRYAFRIKEWQLGNEEDGGYGGMSQLPEIVEGVRTEFDRVGRNTEILLPWPGTQSLPANVDPKSVYLSRPVGNADISSGSIPIRDPEAGRTRVHLIAESRGTDSYEVRVRTLALAALNAKLERVASITYRDPLDTERGLFRKDGAPTELFLPWRQLASTLGGAEYLGTIQFPHRVSNAVFRRGAEVFLVLWSDAPVRESFSLGYDARPRDMWGRAVPAIVNEEQGTVEFEIGPMPVFLRHCAAGVVEWYLSLQFEQGRLRSEYGQHPEALLGRNPFPQGVNGKVILRMPADWDVDPSHWDIQAAAGESWRLPMLITFPPDGALGEFHTDVDFQIVADRPYRFTVHLPYTLGMQDFEMDLEFRRLSDGRLEVVQRLVNKTRPLEMFDFECNLFVPGQVRQKLYVPRLGAGEDRRLYILPDADGLKGKELWLRCEQVDGRRVLNLRKKVAF